MTRTKEEHPMHRRHLLTATTLVAAGALVLGACSSGSKKSVATTTSTAGPIVCPLTDQPAPNNQVPQRPAVGVKIDNYSAARPQSGMDAADIIFEEPVEGGITRYNAVFQCQDASKIGPVRSARQIDIGIESMFHNAGLAHIGGIQPVLSNITASGIPNLDLGNYANSFVRDNSRYAPYNAYTSTAQLYALLPNQHTPPTPVYTYSTTAPKGTQVTSVNVDFSDQSNVTWNWNASTGTWLRFYNGSQADMLTDNVQNQAQNVIVQVVHVTYGPWLENSEGGLEVQAQLWNTSGPAKIFRNGVEVDGTWSRGAQSSPTVFKDAKGKVIAMAPGRTWVELLPDTASSTSVPAASTTTTAK
jgi:Protein of unknown function (DUF3048) N-terminal domain/Protein of unknown function (DUF3048) C-terminal domain